MADDRQTRRPRHTRRPAPPPARPTTTTGLRTRTNSRFRVAHLASGVVEAAPPIANLSSLQDQYRCQCRYPLPAPHTTCRALTRSWSHAAQRLDVPSPHMISWHRNPADLMVSRPATRRDQLRIVAIGFPHAGNRFVSRQSRRTDKRLPSKRATAHGQSADSQTADRCTSNVRRGMISCPCHAGLREGIIGSHRTPTSARSASSATAARLPRQCTPPPHSADVY